MNQPEITSEDTSNPGFDFSEYQKYRVPIDDSIITNIRRAMKKALTANRAELEKQKIREALVRDYIENKENQPAAIRRVLRDLFSSWS